MAGTPEPNFRRYDPHQNLLLPPSLDDWLPEGHLARFIGELVDRKIDLTPFSQGYDNASGGKLANEWVRRSAHPAGRVLDILLGTSPARRGRACSPCMVPSSRSVG